jgi:hypothetical protein
MEKIATAIEQYQERWQALVAARKDKAFFESLTPTAVCFKAADVAEVDALLAPIREHADHIHWGWINERWLVTVHLRNSSLPAGIQIVKIYQRRPGSEDTLGLDHVDYYAPAIDEDILADEPDLKWTHETNGEHCAWISLWFDGTEAKLRTDTTFDACAKELAELDKQITGTK